MTQTPELNRALALALAVVSVAAPCSAATLEAHVGAGGGPFVAHNANAPFPFVWAATLDAKALWRTAFMIAPQLGVGLMLAPTRENVGDGRADAALVLVVGAGARLFPFATGVARGAFVDVQLDYANATGASLFGIEGALGWELRPFGGSFGVGPEVRYRHLLQRGAGPSFDAGLLSIGLTVLFELLGEPPPRPPAPVPAPSPVVVEAPPPKAPEPPPAKDPGFVLTLKPLDDDGDGLPNKSDRCPAAAETYNGVKDEDGCPDPDAGPALARVRDGVLELLLPISLDSALRLREPGPTALAVVGRLLRLDKGLRIRLSATCGADASGERSTTVATLMRARVLDAGNLEPERVEAVGAPWGATEGCTLAIETLK